MFTYYIMFGCLPKGTKQYAATPIRPITGNGHGSRERAMLVEWTNGSSRYWTIRQVGRQEMLSRYYAVPCSKWHSYASIPCGWRGQPQWKHCMKSPFLKSIRVQNSREKIESLVKLLEAEFLFPPAIHRRDNTPTVLQPSCVSPRGNLTCNSLSPQHDVTSSNTNAAGSMKGTLHSPGVHNSKKVTVNKNARPTPQMIKFLRRPTGRPSQPHITHSRHYRPNPTSAPPSFWGYTV